MTKFEEIEESYAKDIEKLDKDFLQKYKTTEKNKLKELELSYHENLKKTYTDYENKIKKMILEDKFTSRKSSKKLFPKEKYKHLEIKKIDLNETKLERFKRKYNLFRFKIQILKKYYFNKYVPNLVLRTFFKYKILKKRLKEYISNSTRKNTELISNNFKKYLESLKTLLTKIFSKSAEILKRISEILKKIKIKKTKDEKK